MVNSSVLPSNWPLLISGQLSTGGKSRVVFPFVTPFGHNKTETEVFLNLIKEENITITNNEPYFTRPMRCRKTRPNKNSEVEHPSTEPLLYTIVLFRKLLKYRFYIAKNCNRDPASVS